MNRTKLLRGDAMSIMAGMKPNSVDLVLTDPPYRTISGGRNSDLGQRFVGGKSGRPTGILAKNDGKIFKHNDLKPSDYMPALYRVLKPGRDAYVMTNNLNLRAMLNAADEAGFHFHGMLQWLKNTCTPSRWYMKDTELVVYLYKPPARPINWPSSKQTAQVDNPRNKTHPTEKPVELMQHYVTNSTDSRWTVLDPFMGSGSTGVACVNSGRKFVGIELDEEYYSVAVDRIENRQPRAANDNQIDLEELTGRVAA